MNRTRAIEYLGGSRSELIFRAVSALVSRDGAAWLTDEQLEKILARQIEMDRLQARLNRENKSRREAGEDTREEKAA